MTIGVTGLGAAAAALALKVMIAPDQKVGATATLAVTLCVPDRPLTSELVRVPRP